MTSLNVTSVDSSGVKSLHLSTKKIAFSKKKGKILYVFLFICDFRKKKVVVKVVIFVNLKILSNNVMY